MYQQTEQHQERIPLFFFKDVEFGEDPEKSKELGYAVPKIVTMIYVVPLGHKGDPMEFFAEDFIARKQKESRAGIFNPAWADEYKKGFEAYRQGREIPRSGTPTISWEKRLLKARREQLAIHFPTLEDLAAVPDNALEQIGPFDGRQIRDDARAEISSKKGLEPILQELAATKELLKKQAELIAELQAKEKPKSKKVEA